MVTAILPVTLDPNSLNNFAGIVHFTPCTRTFPWPSSETYSATFWTDHLYCFTYYSCRFSVSDRAAAQRGADSYGSARCRHPLPVGRVQRASAARRAE